MDQSTSLINESAAKNVNGSENIKCVGADVRKQYIIAICVNLGQILVGFAVCWTAPMIPKLQKPESNPLPDLVTETEASWIAAIMTLGVIVGGQIGGYLSNIIGRKSTLLLMGICEVIGTSVLVVAVRIDMVYFGRFVSGLGAGGTAVVNMVYIGEIASPKIRGRILTSTGVSHTCGGLLVYVVAPFVSYSVVGYLGVFVSALYFLGGFYILESPIYYVIKGQNDDARTTLRKLGRTEDIETVLNAMIQHISHKQSTKPNWMELFSLKRNRKALLITTTLALLQQLSGIMCIMFFATAIFEKAGSSIQPYIATMILGVTQVLGIILTPYFVEEFGRKTLMLISSSFCGLCTGLLGVHFYLESIKHPLVDSIRWMPLVMLVSFLFFFNAGLGIIPNVIVGEMFSPNVRSTGSSIAMCLGWGGGVFSALSFGYISSVGSEAIFAIFSATNILGFFFVLFCMPETKGKSLTEIEEMLEK